MAYDFREWGETPFGCTPGTRWGPRAAHTEPVTHYDLRSLYLFNPLEHYHFKYATYLQQNDVLCPCLALRWCM